MCRVLEETVSGRGAPLVKENELQSSRVAFEGGVASVCRCDAALVWMLSVLKRS